MTGHTTGHRLLARFDDLVAGSALEFAGPASVLGLQTLVAEQPVDVIPVLREVETATAAGRWAAGFVSYEAATALDPTLPTRPAVPGEPCGDVPLAWFGLFDTPRSAAALQPRAPGASPGAWTCTPWQPGWDQAVYRQKLETIRCRIAAGDTYQCNLTVRMHATVAGDLFELYRDLAVAQRGAHHAYLDAGRFVIASASPELFFDWREDRLTTRPMKGTAPRGRWLEEDTALRSRLAASPKERAENVMIVDLVRNDLGKVAAWGSVEVPALFELERYETLWQLTSTVTARPRPGSTLVDLFRALFPCASVTGAPKRSTMAMIAQLEEDRRGVYCGAIGVVAPPGAPFRARFNVAIRTAVVDRSTGAAVYGTGGGITWDSDPGAEHDELVAKAAVLRRPVEEFSLVETMAFRPGQGLVDRRLHLERMRASAAYFGFDFQPEWVDSALDGLLVGLDAPSRVRVEVERSGEPSVEAGLLPPHPACPVRVAVDLVPVDSSDVRLFHKTTRRSPYEERAARHPGVDDVLLVNERGELTESTIANLAVRLDGRWWTPPVGSGCLPGIGRGRLIEQGRLTERPLFPAQLDGAEGVALVSSVRGWRPALLVP